MSFSEGDLEFSWVMVPYAATNPDLHDYYDLRMRGPEAGVPAHRAAILREYTPLAIREALRVGHSMVPGHERVAIVLCLQDLLQEYGYPTATSEQSQTEHD